jgi:hypothetical protein
VSRVGRVADALRARRGERGATLVETAIIIPVLMLLTFGAIEFGIAFRDSAAISSSTRAGARIASASTGADTAAFNDNAKLAVSDSLKDLMTADPQELVIYRADGNGNPPGGFGGCSDCMRYTWNAGSKTWAIAGGDPWTLEERTLDICTGGLPSVGVYVKAEQPFITGLFGATKTLTHKTSMRLEPASTEQCNGV